MARGRARRGYGVVVAGVVTAGVVAAGVVAAGAVPGAETGRRVVSQPGELRETAPPPTRTVLDPALPAGRRVVESEGQPARAVTVKRTVYDRDGNVLRSESWHTAYRGEHQIVRVGGGAVSRSSPGWLTTRRPVSAPQRPTEIPSP